MVLMDAYEGEEKTNKERRGRIIRSNFAYLAARYKRKAFGSS